ncbi:MAG: putative lipid II flippase FtsW [Alphaproteobacteria bacterium]|jgi:cell division protein FtsW|nr:putative lipid II flippase FtsW [Alphaproteobacteria bacterium]
MTAFAILRSDTTVIGRWLWTVDKTLLALLLLLMGVGFLLLFAASPAVAEGHGLSPYYFVMKQGILLPIALLILVGTSLLTPKGVRRIACLGLLFTYAALVATLFLAPEIKGATRWVSIAGFTLQASEFAKPTLAVVSAWMFAEWAKNPVFPGRLVALLLYALAAGLIILQPDLGMTIVLSAVWWGQFFLAGMPLLWLIIFIPGVMGAGVLAYTLLPHVKSRMDRFLNPDTGDTYQIDQSLRAIGEGGWFGVGPGEGHIKNALPDAHADFIFAVAVEEFGVIACSLLLLLIVGIFWRGCRHVLKQDNLFIMLAVSGILIQFITQSFINIASTVHLIPTKGMTLPFVSYGGSSLLALAFGMGVVLALTRKGAAERLS